jgi:uroporphyrin-III C-methyltransferase / precorrin-2 dehydrogenase / sirohydrochlorin ferrochelatase
VDFFPVFLNLYGRSVLVVGAGAVAWRKTRTLLDAGARPTVVAPTVSAPMEALAVSAAIRLHQRRFRADDVRGHWLVVNACGNPAVAAEVAHAADAAKVFCNSVDDLERCSYIVPALVKRSPLLVAISTGGTAPVLARRLRAHIESLLSADLGRIAALAGRWRDRVARAFDDSGARRRFWERLFDGRLETAWASGGEEGAAALIASDLAAGIEAEDARGMAWLVGAGPGDPGLLTLKALQAMQAADVILYDRLVSGEILELARRDAECISVGKSPGCKDNSQSSINSLLVALVADGKRVCRLKGGDPFVFGRGGEEAEALEKAGLPYIVIPGITAALGCAAAAGIPLTHRDAAQSLTLLTGHGKDAIDTIDWAALARGRQTLAIYMGVRRFPELMQQLTRHGRPADTPVAIIERGTMPGQRVLRGTLGQLPMLAAAHQVEAPALLIVGEVARRGASRPAIVGADPGGGLGRIAEPESAINAALR